MQSHKLTCTSILVSLEDDVFSSIFGFFFVLLAKTINGYVANNENLYDEVQYKETQQRDANLVDYYQVNFDSGEERKFQTYFGEKENLAMETLSCKGSILGDCS